MRTIMLSLKSPKSLLCSFNDRTRLSLVMANTVMAQNGTEAKISNQTSNLNGFR